MAEPVFTRPLTVFLVLVGLVVLRCLDDRAGPDTLGEVLQQLHDNDLEGAERQALLRRVLSGANGSSDREVVLPAAMAAVSLGDAASYARLAALSPGPVAVAAADDAALVQTATLGDPLLARLLAAMEAEVQGRREDAVRRYTQVQRSARLWHATLCERLAADALARLPH